MSSDANSIAAQKRRQVRNPKTGRKKTSIACQHCWKSKTRCGVKRPCDRCVRLGHKDCHDRPEATRKRQHTNKTKNIHKTINKNTNNNNNNNNNSVSVSPTGYLASNDSNINLPPIIQTPIISTPTSLPYIQTNNNNNNKWISINGNTSINNTGSSSDTTITTQNNNLDVNYGSKQLKNYNNISELLIGGGHVITNISNISNISNNCNKLSKLSKKKRDTKNKKKRNIKKKDKKTGKKRKYRDNDNDNNDNEHVMKKRKLNEDLGNENDNNNNNNKYSNEIIYWDYQHKEIDPFSDSSHYSTEYDTDKNNDPSPAVIISINKDNNKDNNEVWSHYTFTRGSLSKFVSVDQNNNNTNNKNKKRSRIPLKKMAKSQKDKTEKRDRTIEEDLAAILGPIGMVTNNNKKNNIKIKTNRINNSLHSSVLFKQIPTNNHIFNTFTQTNNSVLSQIIPIPNIHQLHFNNEINPYNIQHISNNLSTILPTHLTIPSTSNTNTIPPTMTRITSLIPAPQTNNINAN